MGILQGAALPEVRFGSVADITARSVRSHSQQTFLSASGTSAKSHKRTSVKGSLSGKLKAGDLDVGHPPLKSFLLLAGTFARFRGLLHLFRQLRLERVKIERCAPLHRWEIQEGLHFLGH